MEEGRCRRRAVPAAREATLSSIVAQSTSQSAAIPALLIPSSPARIRAAYVIVDVGVVASERLGERENAARSTGRHMAQDRDLVRRHRPEERFPGLKGEVFLRLDRLAASPLRDRRCASTSR